MPPASVAELSRSLTLRAAAAEYFGPVLLIPVAAALIIGAAAFVVMRLYVRAVFRESRRSSPDPQAERQEEIRRPERLLETGPLEIRSEELSELARTGPARTPTFRHAAIAFRRAACVYTLAGLVFAAATLALCNHESFEGGFRRIVTMDTLLDELRIG